MTVAKESLRIVLCKIKPEQIKNQNEEIQGLVHEKRLVHEKFMNLKSEEVEIKYREKFETVERKSGRLQ